MAYVITQNCCNDATCVTVCPVNCIHPTPDEPDYATSEMLYIDPAGCIDCGACVDVCPVNAIQPDFELAEGAERYPDLNAHYFTAPGKQDYSPAPYQHPKPKIEVAQPCPLRVAIVGSGPAACYAAEELLARKGIDVEVTMFERLPAPWGLVRFGVAPDHQATKSVADLFAATAKRKGFSLRLNVEVGKHLSHEELLAHHHAVLYAVGAPRDRRLGIPGEDLPGSHPATDFVAWYNGHPDYAGHTFDFSAERAVIVGNGNVALDVARILASDVDRLARTDIAEHALAALSGSKISEVVVLGRRGPAQAAFTIPELLGLAGTGDFDVVADPAQARLDPVTAASLDPHAMAALKVKILGELADRPLSGFRRRVVLRFLGSPEEVLGTDRVRGIRVGRNELTEVDGRLVARPDGTAEELDCGLVLRSIGYRGEPVPGMPFDDLLGRLPNESGRVVDPDTGAPLPGVYTAGWIKRGPSGVIGTNKKCAEETVEALFADFAAGRLPAPANGGEALETLISERQPDALDYPSWTVVDRHERTTAKPLRRPRIKLTSAAEMRKVVEDARKPM
ncbi:FAD-dependent oxidoreductase [Amycolatopsis panacis]|uniref:ferredoxin--NADP(+) reductase n=1 Tax=Amycolatopsis panacis TaxID=2340917 RepID=A0A419I7J8_9PSEU|nr:FAD-dependent oxidoreductase [Amycolatopsis panacis]RJQ87861.1 ferredoxin [Amycolatopsis panacis]